MKYFIIGILFILAGVGAALYIAVNEHSSSWMSISLGLIITGGAFEMAAVLKSKRQWDKIPVKRKNNNSPYGL